jgi:hypothetical protein
MTAAQRFSIAGAAAAAAEVALGFLLAGTILEPYFWVTAALTLAVTQLAARLMRPPGGGPPRGGDPPPDPEPPWWPDFERELRAHLQAALQDTARR